MKVSRSVAGCVGSILWCAFAAAQPARSSLEVLKSQSRSAADSVADGWLARLRADAPIRIHVARSEQRMLAENAFLESFRAHGIASTLGEDDATGPVLYVQPLSQESQRRELGSGKVLRSIRSVFDVRLDNKGASEMLVSGLEYSLTDTVATSVVLADENEDSFFDRYLQPLVMVAGAGIIVYLFFTVRS